MASTSLDNFCGSEFWNSSLTWYTDDPDFTNCFEKTVLVWVPCLFLWTFASLEVYYISNSKKRDIRWNFLNITKLLSTVLLIVLSFADLATNFAHIKSEVFKVYDVDIYTPVIKVISFALSAILLVCSRKKGLRISGLQFLFWLLLAVCGAPQLRSEIREEQKETHEPHYSRISYFIYYPVVLLILLLNCFADREPKYTHYPKTERPCPKDGSSFLSRIFFSWFDPLVWKGFKKPLEANDLWNVRHEDSAREVARLFHKHWEQSLHKQDFSTSADASFDTSSRCVNIIQKSKKKPASVLPALVKAFGPTIVFGAFLNLIQDLLTFASPQILRLLIAFIEQSEAQWKGYFYVGLLLIAAILQTVILSQYFYRMRIVGMRIRTALVSAIYRKALRMSNAARKESTVGEIVNLMAVDAQIFVNLMLYLNMIWSSPLQIILALYFLWDILGPSVLAGFAVMIILIPVNGYMARREKMIQTKQMKNKDERVKLMNEILNGIKVLKLYAWEPSFKQQVLKIRAKEVNLLKQGAYVNAGMSFLWSCAPFLVSVVTFATYVLVDENNVLDATTAFVSLSLFNILRLPLNALPIMISNMVQAGVSIQRINKFMNCEELDPKSVSHDPSELLPLVMENCTFSWDEDIILKNINIRLEKGSLNAIVGSVGAGKSSLVSAFLGEMHKISGRVNTVGKIAYVSQQAWIQNCTLQENILFGKELNKALYKKVIEACALEPDFDMLPAGDQTEIGEKGINLSGGQKQRVSLARAVYANADTYFLDDPLSAVDSHVGKHIFEEVIGPGGLLKNCTRVLVTHGITYLPQTDKIVVLKDGEVSEIGTYQELLDKKGDFSDFLVQHINEAEDENKPELNTQLSQTSETLSELSNQNGSVPKQSMELGTKSMSKDENKEHGVVVGKKLIAAEKAEVGGVKWDVYNHYIKSIGVLLTFVAITMNVLYEGFSIASNFWLSIWSSDNKTIVNGTMDTAKRDMYLGVYGALGLGQCCMTLLANIVFALACINAARKLHLDLLVAVLRWTMCNYDTTPIGRILNRFSSDVQIVDSTLPVLIQSAMTALLSVLATLVVISYTTPIFISVVIPIALLYYFIQKFYIPTARQLKRLDSVSRSPIYSHFGETVMGVSTIRAFGEQERYINESERKVDLNQVCYYPSIIANRWLAVRLEMVGNLVILFTALFAVLGKDLIPGIIGLTVSYALQITQTLNWMVRMTSDVETNIVALERIKEYREAPQEAPWQITNRKPASSWPETGQVCFKNFSVRYRPGLDLVLKGVSFSINASEKVGIVGRTGAGKSSLTLSLFRLIEASEGEITIDGVNIASLGLHDLRSRLTIIPQDAILFSGSLRINLDPFNTHSDEEIWRALEHAHLKVFVKGLPAGLNHEVTEGGENLSVGQRQLICLGRALLRKSKILILDEATAAVDLTTDDLIQRTIRTEFDNCTVLTIAHRLNTILDSHRVIVLDKGHVVEFDSPSKLLHNRKSIFYGMCKDAGLV